MRVYFSPAARQSLRDISDYAELFSSSGGARVRRRIIHRVRQLAAFPESGRMVPEFDTPIVRELIEGPYRIWYRLLSDEVEVIAVFHGSRDARRD